MRKRPAPTGQVLKLSPNYREQFLPLHTKAAQPLRDYHMAEAGICEVSPGYELRRTDPVFHLLIYTVGGQGWLSARAETRSLRAGQLLIVPAHLEFGYKPGPERWQFLWFHLLDADEWRYLASGEVSIRSTVSAELLRNTMEGYLKESRRKDAAGYRAARLYAELIAIYLERDLKPHAEQGRENMEERLYILWNKVSEALARDWRVTDLAAELGISASHLHRVVLKHSAMTPLQMVTWLRMQRAQELLIASSAPLHVIAEQLGYDNQFAFSVAFKRLTGVSPREFRKRQ